MAEIPVRPPDPAAISRAEAQACGVPPTEVAPFREWLRTHLRAELDLLDPLQRTATLIEHTADYVLHVKRLAKGQPDAFRRRLADLEGGLAMARVDFERSMSMLAARQPRELPRLPHPATTGALPTGAAMAEAMDAEPAGADPERWDPAWGPEPEGELRLPPVLPQGMRRLPKGPDVQIAPRKPRKPA